MRQMPPFLNGSGVARADEPGRQFAELRFVADERDRGGPSRGRRAPRRLRAGAPPGASAGIVTICGRRLEARDEDSAVWTRAHERAREHEIDVRTSSAASPCTPGASRAAPSWVSGRFVSSGHFVAAFGGDRVAHQVERARLGHRAPRSWPRPPRRSCGHRASGRARPAAGRRPAPAARIGRRAGHAGRSALELGTSQQRCARAGRGSRARAHRDHDRAARRAAPIGAGAPPRRRRSCSRSAGRAACRRAAAPA